MWISGGNDDIPMSTLRNAGLQVETRIVCIIQAKEPVLCVPGQPLSQRFIPLNSFPFQNLLVICLDCFMAASINEEDFCEAATT
jgi:hypothetical protein